MAINIQEILHPSDSDSIKFGKINYNFDQILANGGGPMGPIGQTGDQGLPGTTGQKGDQGEKGDQGDQGVAGLTDTPWYRVEVNAGNGSTNTVSILKPKRSSDNNLPIIWLGDPAFTESVNDGDTLTNARLTIAIDNIYENYIKLQHVNLGVISSLVITSTEVSGFSKFNLKKDYGSSNVEFAITTDKITFTSDTAPLTMTGHGVGLKSINNQNITLETTGSGILDVDIDAEFKGYLRLPYGTTIQRPAISKVGMIRFNHTLDIVEAYYYNSNSPEWRELCTECGTAVNDSINIIGGNINANADGTPITTATPTPTVTATPTATPTSSGGGGTGSDAVTVTATPTPTATPTLSVTVNVTKNNPTAVPTATPTATPTVSTGGGGGGCHLAGELITLANGQTKLIEELIVGDSLLSLNINGLGVDESDLLEFNTPFVDYIDEYTTASVVNIKVDTYTSYYNINNDALKITYEHPVLVKTVANEVRFKITKDVAVGDKMLNENNEWIDVTSIVKVTPTESFVTYSLDIEDYDVYFANGYLVHNLVFAKEEEFSNPL